jgi:hypothetical protein
MLKSLLIGVVVSVIVWALGFDFFFAYRGTVLSFAVSVAAGVITVLLLRAVTSKVAVHLAVVAIVVLAALYFSSKLVPRKECPVVTEAQIHCGSAAVVPDCFSVKKGTSFIWNTQSVPDGAMVRVHSFKKKFFGTPFPSQPLDKKEYASDNKKNISAKVDGIHGTFKYSITCTQNGVEDTKDPMIEVPKR